MGFLTICSGTIPPGARGISQHARDGSSALNKGDGWGRDRQGWSDNSEATAQQRAHTMPFKLAHMKTDSRRDGRCD